MLRSMMPIILLVSGLFVGCAMCRENLTSRGSIRSESSMSPSVPPSYADLLIETVFVNTSTVVWGKPKRSTILKAARLTGLPPLLPVRWSRSGYSEPPAAV